MASPTSRSDLKDALVAEALRLGFDAARVTHAAPFVAEAAQLLARNALVGGNPFEVGDVAERTEPERFLPGARSILAVAWRYPALAERQEPEAPTGYLYVTAVDPNTTFKVMLDEARRLQTQTAPENELAGTKSLFLTGFLSGSETVDGQAGLLARALIYGGDWHLARTLPDRIRAVTAADVQHFAQTRMQHLQTVVLGDPAKVDPKLFQSL